MEAYFLGVEIGGTKQQLAVGNADGKIIEKLCEKVPLTKGAQSIKDWLKIHVPVILNKYNNVKSACIGFGGPLETETGRVLLSVQVPGWENFEFKKWFEYEFKICAHILNDTVAGGYAELILGVGRNAKNFFYTNIGTGIGGALFIEGRYFDGIGCGAVYLGNTYIPDPLSSESGAWIKMENICSGVATERRLRKKDYVPKESLLYEICGGDTEKLTCMHLGEAAMAGDEFALGEIEFYARSYALGLANMMICVSPDVVAIGGGVSNLGEILLQPIRRQVEKIEFASLTGRYKILQSSLKDDIVTVGAILYAAARYAGKA